MFRKFFIKDFAGSVLIEFTLNKVEGSAQLFVIAWNLQTCVPLYSKIYHQTVFEKPLKNYPNLNP